MEIYASAFSISNTKIKECGNILIKMSLITRSRKKQRKVFIFIVFGGKSFVSGVFIYPTGTSWVLKENI